MHTAFVLLDGVVQGLREQSDVFADESECVRSLNNATEGQQGRFVELLWLQTQFADLWFPFTPVCSVQ